jgi:DNA replication and repair protein RecF
MRLTRITLSNFRNYTQVDLPLPGGPILLHGGNAQGKTTLLEAIYYLATTKSPHTNNDRQLLNWYANGAENLIAVGRLTAEVAPARDGRLRQLEMRLIREQSSRWADASFRREVLVNGVKVRLMDLLGNLNVVLFLPEDVALVSAPPAERRRYLDITLCQVDRRYCQALSQYNKVLSQRNALLRALQEERRGPAAAEQLQPWDQQMARSGALILLRRAKMIAELERQAGEIHFRDLTGEAESLRLIYHPRLQPNSNTVNGIPNPRPGPSSPQAPAEGRDKGNNQLSLFRPGTLEDPAGWLLERSEGELAAVLREALQASYPMEIQRGSTLVGPHRDDLRFLVNGRDLADFGSRGQQRTAVLALKLAEAIWMEARTGERPVLLLDEVLAELDRTRRAFLLDHIGAAEQAILTATDPTMFTSSFLAQATRMEVAGGHITPDHPGKESE